MIYNPERKACVVSNAASTGVELSVDCDPENHAHLWIWEEINQIKSLAAKARKCLVLRDRGRHLCMGRLFLAQLFN